ncbi:MAG: DUF3782 domain-containing protein [bacterium]
MTTQETELNAQEIWRLFKETDQKFKELADQSKETDQKFKEMAQSIKETTKQIKATHRRVDALTSKWGRFVEGLIVPGVKRLFHARGIEVEKVYQRVRAHKNGGEMEIDILAIDEGYVVLIEAKSTLSVEDVNEHLERLAAFKTFFPEYKNKKALGAVAGIVIDEGADRHAYRQGLYVIAQSGETVKILNDMKFKPKTW